MIPSRLYAIIPAMSTDEPLSPDSVPSTGTWVSAGQLSAGRVQCAAAPLPDGKIIVCGGFTGTAPSKISDLFDSGQWRAAESMREARNAHSATVLDNDKILVCGGFGTGSVTLKSAELYDPGAKRWSDAGEMPSRFGFHHAVCLRNGKVLVFEGTTPSCCLDDPGSGQWTRLAATAERVRPAVVLLPNGKVLVCGGSVKTAQLFDPDSNSWTSTTSMETARLAPAATLLSNVKVLVCGGRVDGRYLTSAEIYDPLAGTWRTSAGALATGRAYASATPLPNGKVLIAGGTTAAGKLDSAELYDSFSDRFSATGSMQFGRFEHPALPLSDGSVLVVDGQAGWSSAERYVPHPGETFGRTGSMAWARVDHVASVLPDESVLVAGGQPSFETAEVFTSGKWKRVASMHYRRAGGHSATLLPLTGKVLVTGGWNRDAYNPFNESELFDGKETWTLAAPMSIGRTGHAAIELGDGTVLVAGGMTYASGRYVSLKSAEIYSSNGWKSAGEMPSVHSFGAAARLADGRVLVTAGDAFSQAVELFDPSSGKWRSGAPMRIGRKATTATTLLDGRVLIVGGGGDGTWGNHLAVAELYDPRRDQWTPTGKMLTGVSGHCATRLRDGRVLVSGGETAVGVSGQTQIYNPGSEMWSPGPLMHAGRAEFAAVTFKNGEIMVTGGRGWGDTAIAELCAPV